MTYSIIQSQRLEMQSFKSVDQLNKSIRAYLYRYKKALYNANTHYKDLNAAGKVFKVLYTHSVKCPGVAYLSNNSIAKLTDLNIRTVKRATNKLQELGIMLKIATKRENGSDSSNTYVIKPLLSSFLDRLFKSKKGHDHPTLPPLESKSFKHLKQEKDNNISNLSEYKTILMKFAEYKINDIIEKRIIINSPSSYLMRVFKNEIQKAEAKQQMRANKLKRGRQQQKQSIEIPLYNWLVDKNIPNNNQALNEMGVY